MFIKEYNKYQELDQGYSLIEILVTIIIVGIISAIASPSLIGLYNQNLVKDSLRQVQSALKEAQRQAIRKGKTCKIKLDQVLIRGKTRERVTVVVSSDPGESGNNYNHCLTRDRVLPLGVDLVNNIPGSTDKITFSPKGSTVTSGTIKLSSTSTSLQKCLVISNGLGIMRVGNYEEKPSGSMASKCKRF